MKKRAVEKQLNMCIHETKQSANPHGNVSLSDFLKRALTYRTTSMGPSELGLQCIGNSSYQSCSSLSISLIRA